MFDTMLPMWLRGSKRKVIVHYRGHKTDKSKTDRIPIEPREEDRALFVGSSVKILTMQADRA